MMQMLPMCHSNNNSNNKGSQWPPSCIFFVFVGIVATSYAKSFEAFEDFPETFAATTSDLTMELERLMHLKSVSNKYNNKTCNYKTIKNLTSLAGSAGRGAFVANKLLSRRKRFLVFPLGSSFSCAVCLTTGVIGNPSYQYLSMGLNWGLAYDLPNATWVLDHIHALERKNDDTDMEKPIIKRRHRRDLYHKMETIINSMFMLTGLIQTGVRSTVGSATRPVIPAAFLMQQRSSMLDMFWLNTVSNSLYDYRLIAINALIYYLIATEIVNVNAHIVIAVNGMTEFDKSATVQKARTTTKTPSKMHSNADETQSLAKGSTTITTTKANNEQAELAFLDEIGWVEVEGDVENELDEKNNNNSKFGFAIPRRSATTISSSPFAARTVTEVVVSRPFDMMTDNCNRFDNGISIMPTINESVDNFQNDKEQIASAAMAATTTPQAMCAQQNINGMTARTTTAPTRTASERAATTMATAISRPSTIKTNVITAIKSPATQFTKITSTLTSSSSSAAAKASLVLSKITTKNTTTTKSNTSIMTMSKMPAMVTTKAPPSTATTISVTTTQALNALLWWPTLHGHDLLSSTNGMPNCRVTPKCTNVLVKCQDAAKANEKRKLSSKQKTLDTSSAPPTMGCSGKQQNATTRKTTKEAKLATWSTTYVKSSISRQRVKAMATIKSTEIFTTLINKNNNNKVFKASRNYNTTIVTAKPTSALHIRLSTPAATAISCNTTTAVDAKTTTTKRAPTTPNSTGTALQSHWQRILSRRKRYLAFPEGSSFSVALCFTVGIIGNPSYNYMSFGINWGVSYDLPNATWVLNQLHGLTRRPTPPVVLHRRSKRALYERISETVDNMGYNGRDCVLRALCESRQYFTRNKMGMIGEMLRVIFSLPKKRLFTRELHENSDIAVYDHAYRKARAMDCATQYQCSFSLLELAFGKYAKPPTDYYNNEFGM